MICRRKKEKNGDAYLLVSKPKLVLQNGLSVAEMLNLVGKNGEVFNQGSGEFLIVGLLEGHYRWMAWDAVQAPQDCASILWFKDGGLLAPDEACGISG